MSTRSFNSILVALLVAAAAAAELKVEVYDGPKGKKVLFTPCARHFFLHTITKKVLPLFLYYLSP